jgi:hypothetical protein
VYTALRQTRFALEICTGTAPTYLNPLTVLVLLQARGVAEHFLDYVERHE